MRKCSISELDLIFEKISSQRTLYIPKDTPNGANYSKWEKGDKLSEALNTTRSAKDFFFPQTENLMEFKTIGKQIEIIDTRSENEDFVIFGVRACDVKSFEVLDRVFLQEPYDSYYANRRQHAVVVSIACTRPEETCFCKTFGIDATAPEGDISCWRTENDIFFKANTPKGEKLMESLEELTAECDDKEVKKQQEDVSEIMKRLPLADLTTEGFGTGKTEEYFNSPQWAELSQACLGCGTCTFVCPTCQCYDIKDFKTGNGVVRFRCWDSCMYSDFTKMAHGNSRLTQLERFRQRFMHKLVYYPENNDGLYSCVGCGRCLAKCPISMNIVKVMKTLGGSENA